MKWKIVGLLLGILIGSLFVVSAYPREKESVNVQYSAPAVEEIPGNGYTTYILYTKDSLPIDPGFLIGTIPKLVEQAAPRAEQHFYALPALPKRLVVVGYGVKILDDGRTSTLIIATRWDAHISPEKLHSRLVKWGEEAPRLEFFEGHANETPDSQGEWMIKTVDNTGKTEVFSTNNAYWCEFTNPVTLEITDPPYGKIHLKFYLYGPCNDEDLQRKCLLVAPDGNGEGGYGIDPGYELRTIEGNTNYGKYITRSVKIIHNWSIEPNLNSKLDEADPVEPLSGHNSTQATIGCHPAVTFSATIPDSEILAAIDRSTETATWLLKFNTGSNDAKYSFETNVASKASISEEAIHDGRWHATVNVKLQATFQECRKWFNWRGDHTTEGSVTIYMKAS